MENDLLYPKDIMPELDAPMVLVALYKGEIKSVLTRPGVVPPELFTDQDEAVQLMTETLAKLAVSAPQFGEKAEDWEVYAIGVAPLAE